MAANFFEIPLFPINVLTIIHFDTQTSELV